MERDELLSYVSHSNIQIHKILRTVNEYIPPCFPHDTLESTYAPVDPGQMTPLAECTEQ